MAGRKEEELKDLTLLGHQGTTYSFTYNPNLLEVFDNKHPDRDYFVKFNCPEFTSLCPKTGQPDFATIYISYIPDKKCVESKSLKLYLFSFRNHGDFHEDCVNIIMNDLIKVMEPRYIEVWGKFTRAAAFPSIRTATGGARGRNTKKWRNIGCSTTTCIQKKSTTARDEKRGSFFAPTPI